MREIQDHKIYELLKTKYDRIGLDYVILQLGNYEGEKSHKTASLIFILWTDAESGFV